MKINEKDNIIVELNLKKLSDNFNIDYETIKDKYNKLIKNKKEVVIKLDLHDGCYSATAYGCDLTYDYVKINAEYTT